MAPRLCTPHLPARQDQLRAHRALPSERRGALGLPHPALGPCARRRLCPGLCSPRSRPERSPFTYLELKGVCELISGVSRDRGL